MRWLIARSMALMACVAELLGELGTVGGGAISLFSFEAFVLLALLFAALDVAFVLLVGGVADGVSAKGIEQHQNKCCFYTISDSKIHLSLLTFCFGRFLQISHNRWFRRRRRTLQIFRNDSFALFQMFARRCNGQFDWCFNRRRFCNRCCFFARRLTHRFRIIHNIIVEKEFVFLSDACRHTTCIQHLNGSFDFLASR